MSSPVYKLQAAVHSTASKQHVPATSDVDMTRQLYMLQMGAAVRTCLAAKGEPADINMSISQACTNEGKSKQCMQLAYKGQYTGCALIPA